MTERRLEASTDIAWEEWGRRDPYFGVITDPKFRRCRLDEQTKREFFASGKSHVNGVLDTIRRYVDPGFTPRTVLDFGCGVGRLLVPFAKIGEEVVGLDVSSSMLQEARRNCDDHRLSNVHLFMSDDDLSSLTGRFDLIHSCIVFQHISVDRGRSIFSKLLRHLGPGGVGALQLTYSKTRFASTHGVAPPESILPYAGAPALSAESDPEIQMNPYNLNEILFSMQSLGIQRTHVEFTDHGGELGVFLFFSASGTK